MIPYVLVLVLAFGTAAGASQVPDAAPCKLLTAEDVIGVFGAKPTTQGIELMPGICEWSMLSVSLTVIGLTIVNPADAAQRVPDVAPKSDLNYIYRVEPDLGDHAMSIVSTRGYTIQLTVVKGTRMLGFEVKGRTTKLDPDVVLPRLRTLARRLLERAPAAGIELSAGREARQLPRMLQFTCSWISPASGISPSSRTSITASRRSPIVSWK